MRLCSIHKSICGGLQFYVLCLKCAIRDNGVVHFNIKMPPWGTEGYMKKAEFKALLDDTVNELGVSVTPINNMSLPHDMKYDFLLSELPLLVTLSDSSLKSIINMKRSHKLPGIKHYVFIETDSEIMEDLKELEIPTLSEQCIVFNNLLTNKVSVTEISQSSEERLDSIIIRFNELYLAS